jgi:hypothetical protein
MFFPALHWVEPQLVAEIAYLTWTGQLNRSQPGALLTTGLH